MIELLVFDVDGCLSDGKISYTNSGEEIKSFDIKDGFSILRWNKFGKKSAIITGRGSKIVEKRAKELGIEYVYQNISDKKEVLSKLIKELNIGYENVAAIGDDINDLKQLKSVGWSFAPNDAVDIVKENVKTILSKNGGNGAAREMIDTILEEENLTKEFYKPWF